MRAQRASTYAGAAVALLALVAVAVWLAGSPASRTLGADFAPLMPTSIFKLFLIAYALYELNRARGARTRFTVAAAAFFIAVLSVLALMMHSDPVGLVMAPLLPDRDPFDETNRPVGTAITYLLTAAALALAPQRGRRARELSQLLAIAVGGVALVAIVGMSFHLIRVNVGIPVVGLALPVALALLVASFSLLVEHPSPRLVQLLEFDSPGAVIFRRLLPVAIGVPLLAGWVQALGQRFDWFGVAEGEGVVAVGMIVIFTVLIVWTSGKLDEMNVNRSVAVVRAATHQQWLEVTLATIQEAVVTVDGAMQVGFLNPAAQTLLGVDAAGAVGRNLGELIVLVDEETGEDMASRCADALAEHSPVTISGEPALRAGDGSLRAVEVSVTPILDSIGRLTGGVVVLRDARAHRARRHADREAYAALDRRISDRTRALERTMSVLQENTALLGTIAASTPELIVAKGRDGRIMMVNPAALQAMGLSRAQVLGQKEDDLFGNSEELRRILENDWRVIETRRPIAVEERRTTHAGLRIYLATKSPLRDSEGYVFGIVSVSTDITDRKRAQHELEQLLVTEHRLRGEAERANRAKDEFLAIVSHELRSPLNALKGWSQVLLASSAPDPATVMRAAEAIKRNINHQVRLIDDLLDTARIISGKLELNRRRVNLVDVVNAALEVSSEGAKAKRLELRFDTDRDAVFVDGDHDRLQQIVVNLLSNALKFTPEGGSIETRLRVADAAVVLTVADSGLGIDPDFLPNVFDRFSQADTAMSRRYQGLGIGLALVRNLVELHGGSVRVESPGKGHGSVFTVELPLPPVDEAVMRGNAEAREARESRVALDGIEVWVVDDDPDAREVMTLILTHAGARVRTFDSGAALLAALGEPDGTSFPAVLLLDIAMPGDSGFSVMQRLRESASVPFIPTIAVSALTRLDRNSFATAGFQNCVSKPVDAGILVATITAVLDEPGNRPVPLQRSA